MLTSVISAAVIMMVAVVLVVDSTAKVAFDVTKVWQRLIICKQIFQQISNIINSWYKITTLQYCYALNFYSIQAGFVRQLSIWSQNKYFYRRCYQDCAKNCSLWITSSPSPKLPLSVLQLAYLLGTYISVASAFKVGEIVT